LSRIQIELSWVDKEKGRSGKVGQSFLPFSVIPFLSLSFLPFPVILSILSHSFFSQSFFLFSVIPSADPTCRPLPLLPPSSPALNFPRDLRRASLSGPARPGQRRRPTSSGPTPLRTLIPALQPEDPSTAAPFFFRSGHLGSTVVQPPRRASDRQIPRKSFPSPSRSSPSSAPKPCASVSTGIREEAAAGEPPRRSNSSPPVPFWSC
jgi:hypothetical protein